MADQLTRALVAEIAELQKQQSEALGNAIYLGWTAQELAAWQKRAIRITHLGRQLAEIDASLARAS